MGITGCLLFKAELIAVKSYAYGVDFVDIIWGMLIFWILYVTFGMFERDLVSFLIFLEADL